MALLPVTLTQSAGTQTVTVPTAGDYLLQVLPTDSQLTLSPVALLPAGRGDGGSFGTMTVKTVQGSYAALNLLPGTNYSLTVTVPAGESLTSVTMLGPYNVTPGGSRIAMLG